MKENKKAISLIVLVITIIVMIILAGSIILTLNNTGIIGKASEAVEETDKATLEEIASLAWAEAYAENAASNNKLTGTALENKLKEKIIEALEANGLDPNEYSMKVTTSGVKIVKGWMQNGITVTKGGRTVYVGDTISYDEMLNDYNAGWKILGASDAGELLIVSSEAVTREDGSRYLMTGFYLFDYEEDGFDEIEGLNNECKKYGKGKCATGAKSIKAEDIDRIIRQDKTLYGKGKINEYGNIVTYSYDGEGKIKYTSTNGANGEFDVPVGGFYYMLGNKLVKANLENGPCEITKITNNRYLYKLEDIDTRVRHVLVLDKDYWLADCCVEAKNDDRLQGVKYSVEEFRGTKYASDGSYEHVIATSDGISGAGYESYIRPVVSLSSDVVLTSGSDTEWTY